jgi:Ca2+-binding EF-hand superfamily protein
MKSRLQILGLVSVASFMLAAIPASANDASRNKEIQARFSQCDVNRDGKLTRDEAKGCMPRIHDHFSMIDQQNKGYVTVAEIEALADR